MAKNNVKAAPEVEALGEAMSKTEHFFEENGKKIIYLIIALVALALVIFGYKAAIVEPRAEKASELLYKAQVLLESGTPNYELALNGNATTPGFIEVADNYGSTPSGNLAKHYAGICYLHTGDFTAAAKYLAQYKPVKGVVGSVINAQNFALQGDVAVENDNYAAAVALFQKAAKASDNPLTAPAFLFKAALAAAAAGDSDNAKSIFTEITAQYPGTEEANNADKYLASMK
ncbi:MAG: tetratricopeptide repeat protein [Rikenellaceae bacterium]